MTNALRALAFLPLQLLGVVLACVCLVVVGLAMVVVGLVGPRPRPHLN